MYQYKITKLIMNDGSEFTPGKITVIIGPNNSGKSRSLKDILSRITFNRGIPRLVINDVKWELPKRLADLTTAYPFLEPTWLAGISPMISALNPELDNIMQIQPSGIWPRDVESYIDPRNRDADDYFAMTFGNGLVAYLTTERRLSLLKEISSHNHQIATCMLHALYNSKEIELQIRRIVKEAFGQEIFLDFTGLQNFLIRVGKDFSNIPEDPREALPLLSKCEKLDDQGDGLRSFVGLIASLLVIKRPLFVIDEPELFLHPPQAYRLGRFLASQTGEQRQIILATHSVDVVRGILSKTRDITILRIDRTGNTNSFRSLDPDRINELVTDPLLSSARVLDGLFYSAAVVVEADADAQFYHNVSSQLSRNIDLHFVNANGKYTVPRIMKMYQAMGVRCAGIVDFDVLNDVSDFKRQMEALGLSEQQSSEAFSIKNSIAAATKIPPIDDRLNQTKNELIEALRKIDAIQGKAFDVEKQALAEKEKVLKGIEIQCREISEHKRFWKQYKRGGRKALPGEQQTEFDKLNEILSKKGLFINPYGELESMLTDQEIPTTSDKRDWINRALKLLPNLNVNLEQLPWKFMKAIQDYLFPPTQSN